MYRALRPKSQPATSANGTGGVDEDFDNGKRIFSIGHVLRYSPHNMLLRKLLLEDRVVGDICSVEHTEPVGWWHFAHSYVRGNWRNASISSPSLLAKSCHDIDLLMWLLMSPPAGAAEPHLLQHFLYWLSPLLQKEPETRAAGDATNCMSCPLVDDGCKYSAKRIYVGPGEKSVHTGNTKWPVNVVLPEIEDIPTMEEREAAILEKLAEDYDANTPAHEVADRRWSASGTPPSTAPTASSTPTPTPSQSKTSTPVLPPPTTPVLDEDSHGGGDLGLTGQFIAAVDAVKNRRMLADDAQLHYIGCTLQDVMMSHAMVFAAEDSRLNRKTLDWKTWWDTEVEAKLAA
ncbi:unnamed protein product [Parascedosporium putredinis]|uniref:Gfo/Idh/MocA-like oxidoreductase C-terminal domain-containing protein n=1 Tax=Parascedosporium putredinis TaxID=1442378 RepID=A0A9P1MDF6_9PEZI|nr:unnamed protein product [Parascedosporium putredinis]CAI7998540.1 unnamed protein product [Parascedosporium putredinis]